MKNKIVLISFFSILFCACDKIEKDKDFDKPSLYIAGATSISSPLDTTYSAGYWKDGSFVSITESQSLSSPMVWDIFVSGPDVYTLGFDQNKRVCWKNGNPIFFADQATTDWKSVKVYNGDVYIIGTMLEMVNDKPTSKRAIYWKNGEPVYLTNGSTHARVRDLTVANGSVYAVGYQDVNNIKTATYWKDGLAIQLSDGSIYSSGYAITLSGEDIHIVGNEGKVAKYWKNGIATSLTDGTNNSVASEIQVIDDNVLVAGSEGFAGDFYSRAMYWKNGVATTLVEQASNGFAEVLDMKVINGHTYILISSSTEVYSHSDGYLYSDQSYFLWNDGVMINFQKGELPTALCGVAN